ncbi:IclR family transcriptional regulator [Umezawaea endophytica]|uniref:IclR family transcriptional regulator n=1 Tax=Umezawaea endophytica TaxID=1654476 RepID=A0A9X2VFG4_9PSEU|nr:IclR family transcriptional regulator [Umezawaea endophytica]MCS7475698.1 IclR family transcriptional regulator [Umezawaea endophytica]
MSGGPGAPEVEEGETSSGIARALQVVFAVAESSEPDVGVSELARTLGMSKTVVHRVVRTLVATGFFVVDERTRRYRLGPGAVSVGLAALARLEVPKVAQPHMERLVARTAETATLSARYGDQRMYLTQVLSPQEIRMAVQLGHLFPLHVGGSSKAILASLTPAEIDAYLDRALTGTMSVTSREELVAELTRIRRRGYTVSRGERQVDAGSVAAPVFDATGRVYGSLSICGPVARISDDKVEEYGALIVEAASAVSTGLGYRGRDA